MRVKLPKCCQEVGRGTKQRFIFAERALEETHLRKLQTPADARKRPSGVEQPNQPPSLPSRALFLISPLSVVVQAAMLPSACSGIRAGSCA